MIGKFSGHFSCGISCRRHVLDAGMGAGTVAWFSFFSYVLSRWRARFPLSALRKTLQGLGALMCALAVFFAIRSVMLFVGN